MSSPPWFHPVNVYAEHRHALQLVVEILQVSLKDALPEARRRHPLPGPVPGDLLSSLVRDCARTIALSPAFGSQSLRPAAGRSMGLHLWTWDDLLRIRLRKMPDAETRLPEGDQLELPLDYAGDGLLGQTAELALFWAVKGEGLYRVVLAAPAGWEDAVSMSTWFGAVEVPAPAQPSLKWQRGAEAVGGRRDDDLDDVVELRRSGQVARDDDLDDVVETRRREDGSDEARGDAG